MYAVVEACGRQYQLTSGRFVDVDLVAGEPQSEFVFDKVLMIVNGSESVIGKPVIDGAKVQGKIIAHGKGKKIVVYHYRCKKGERKRHGHKQDFTRIYIDSIVLKDKVLSQVKDAGKSKPTSEKAAAAPKAKLETKKSEGVKAEAKAPKATAATKEKSSEKTTTKKAAPAKESKADAKNDK